MGIKELDIALKYFYENQGWKYFASLNEAFGQPTMNASIRDSVTIMSKLIKDGFLEPNNPISFTEVRITFDGIMFYEAGGYNKKRRKESIQANLQSSQTWAIVVGTLLAGLFGLVEIGKWLYSLYR